MIATATTTAQTVVIITYYFYPKWAGPAERFFRYAPELRKRGVELVFLTKQLSAEHPSEEFIDSFKVIRLSVPSSKREFDFFHKKAIKYLLHHFPKNTLSIHLSSSMFALPELYRMRRSGYPAINLLSMAMTKYQSKNPIKAWGINFFQKRLLLSFPYFISSTNKLLEGAIEEGVKINSSRVISNGVNLERFKPVEPSEKDRLKKELNLSDGPNVLFVGLKTPRKGVLELVRAWKIFKTKYNGTGNLVLVGSDRREFPHLAGFYEEWDKEIKDCETFGIDIRGSVRNIEAYFQACDLFVFLSNLEGLPNVLPESMACGIPVLMNPYVGFSEEVAKPGEHVYLTNREPEQIAMDLDYLLNNPKKLKELKVKAMKWIKQEHDVEVSLDKFGTFFKEIVN